MNELTKEAARRGNQKFDIKLYIQDSNSAWVDFTDRVKDGANQLLDIGSIEVSGEIQLGQYSTQNLSVQMLNNDRFWNRAPSKIYGYKTIDGDDAVFDDFYRKKAKIVRIDYEVQGAVTENDLRVFLIDNINPGSSSTGTATLTLTGLQKRARETSAKTVKNGKIWYRNRPLSYIIRRLLEKIHTGAEIDGFTLPNSIEIQNQLPGNQADLTDYRALSTATRMPHVNSNGEWYNAEYDGLYATFLRNHGSNIKIYADNKEYTYSVANDYITLDDTISSGYFFVNRYTAIEKNHFAKNELLADLLYLRFGEDIISGVFTGLRLYRRALGDLGSSGFGQFGAAKFGENLALPFDQAVSFADATVSPFDISQKASILSSTSQGSPIDVSTNHDIPSGYYACSSFFTAAFSWGQKPLIIEDLDIYYFKVRALEAISSNQIIFTLYKYDGIENTINSLGDGWQPICMCQKNSSTIYIAAINFPKPAIADNTSPAHVGIFEVTSGAVTKIYQSESDTDSLYYTPIEMVYYNNNLYCTLFKRDSIGGNPFLVASHPTTSQNSFSNKTTASAYQYRSLTNNDDGTFVFIQATTGKMFEWTPGSEPNNLDIYDTIGNTDSNIVSNILKKGNSYYGITAPKYEPWNYYDYPDSGLPAGEYALWKLDNYIFPYRPLYDFSDLYIWDALQLLAQFCDYLMNYDNSGNFFFIKRPDDDDEVSESFRNDGTSDSVIQDIQIDDMHAEVYNIAQITPYETTVDPMEVEITLTADSTWDEVEGNEDENDVIPGRSTLNPFYIVLIAVDTNNGFKWKSYYAQVAAQIRQESSGTTLYISLESQTITDSVAVGDEIRMEDSDGNTVIRTIQSIDAENRQVVIDSAPPITLNEGDEIIILNGNENQWSNPNTEPYVIEEKAQEIGDTGVSIRVLNELVTFAIGDKIVVKSNGLILKKNSASIQSAQNVTSIARYGKREYSLSDNRFLDYRFGQNMANKVVKEHSYPRWTGTIIGTLLFDLTVGSLIDMREQNAFPDEKENYVKAYIRRVNYPAKGGMAKYSFRATTDRTL